MASTLAWLSSPVLAGGVFAYDQGRADKIAKGVTVDGVDVGGPHAAQAHAARPADSQPLQRPIIVHHGRRRGRSAPARHGSPSTSTRSSTTRWTQPRGQHPRPHLPRVPGQSLDADVQPERHLLRRRDRPLLDRVRSAVDRTPVDATGSLGRAAQRRPQPRPASPCDASALHRQIRSAIMSATADAHVHRPRTKLRPKVTTDGSRSERHDDRRQPPAFKLRSTRTSSWSRSTRSPSAVRPRDARPAVPHRGQGDQSDVERARTPRGREAWPARSCRAARPTTR